MKRIAWLALSVFFGLPPLMGNAQQQWQYTGSLSSAKRFVTMTALNNGKVLAVGGMANDVPHAECELYDPATATWSLTGSLSVGRWVHSTVKLIDGRVAVFGGQSAGSMDGYPIQTDIIEIYDPATGNWTTAGHLTIPRQHQTASLLLDGRVLIVGGLSDVSAVASAEIFDPSTGSSTAVAPMHQARYEQQATSLIDGRVLVTGGRIGGWNGIFFNESEIYDPVTDAWTVIEPMKQPRMRALLVQFSDGTILSAAGRNSPTSTAPGSETYDLLTGHWSSTDSMKQPCTWLSCVLFPDNRYLATGGFIDAVWTTSTDVLCTPTTEWYDKANARWYYAPTLNQARGQHGSAYLHQTVNDQLPNDFVIVGGGITGNNTYTNTCEVLDIGSWALEGYMAMPANRLESGVGATQPVGNHIAVKYDAENSPVVEYSIPSNEQVSLRLVSVDGRTIKTYDQGLLSQGTYDLSISNSQLPAGAYMAVLQAGGVRMVQKLLIMR